MAEDPACKLCKNHQAVECDIENTSFKSANKLLRHLFDCYQIDVSVLNGASFICESCLDDVLSLSKTLARWSNAQEAVPEDPDELEDSELFEMEREALEDEGSVIEGPDDEESLIEGPDDEMQMESVELTEIKSEPASETEEVSPSKAEPPDFFAAGLGRDGLVLTWMLKDRTKSIKMLCTCCDRVFDILAQIRQHLGKERHRPICMCRVCGSMFDSTQNLLGHVSEKCAAWHSISELEYRCLECGIRFRRFFEIIRHERSAHNVKPRPGGPTFMYRGKDVRNLDVEYRCQHKNCGDRFRFFAHYEKHLRKKHEGRHPYPSQQFVEVNPQKKVQGDPYARRKTDGAIINLPKKLTLLVGSNRKRDYK